MTVVSSPDRLPWKSFSSSLAKEAVVSALCCSLKYLARKRIKETDKAAEEPKPEPIKILEYI